MDVQDPQYGTAYYVNNVTGESCWDIPTQDIQGRWVGREGGEDVGREGGREGKVRWS